MISVRILGCVWCLKLSACIYFAWCLRLKTESPLRRIWLRAWWWNDRNDAGNLCIRMVTNTLLIDWTKKNLSPRLDPPIIVLVTPRYTRALANEKQRWQTHEANLKREIWLQRRFRHPPCTVRGWVGWRWHILMGVGHFIRGSISLGVGFGPCILRRWPERGCHLLVGGKTKVSLSLNHLQLQYQFTLFSKAAK